MKKIIFLIFFLLNIIYLPEKATATESLYDIYTQKKPLPMDNQHNESLDLYAPGWTAFSEDFDSVEFCSIDVALLREIPEDHKCYKFKDVPPIILRAREIKEELTKLNLSKETLNRLKNKDMWIGMPEYAAKLIIIPSYGYPDKVNTTITAAGESVQWVYNTRWKALYIYFNNEKLSGLQK